MSTSAALALVSAVFLGFALIHSILVTERAKAAASRALGEHFVRAFYRLIYTIISFITTLAAAHRALRRQIPRVHEARAEFHPAVLPGNHTRIRPVLVASRGRHATENNV